MQVEWRGKKLNSEKTNVELIVLCLHTPPPTPLFDSVKLTVFYGTDTLVTCSILER
jgi:hypothetical protein